MKKYLYRGSPGELLPDEVIDIYLNTPSSEWLFDDETSAYGYRPNLLVHLEPKENGSYDLVYARTPIAFVSWINFNKRSLKDIQEYYEFEFIDLRKDEDES